MSCATRTPLLRSEGREITHRRRRSGLIAVTSSPVKYTPDADSYVTGAQATVCRATIALPEGSSASVTGGDGPEGLLLRQPARGRGDGIVCEDGFVHPVPARGTAAAKPRRGRARLPTVVALKVSKSRLNAREAVAREAGLLATLGRHPGIVRSYPDILPAHEDDTGVTLPLEYVPHGDLYEYIATRGALPLPDVLALGFQVSLALAHCHARRVAHRDVKPENLLVAQPAAPATGPSAARPREEPGPGQRLAPRSTLRVKLADFALAVEVPARVSLRRADRQVRAGRRASPPGAAPERSQLLVPQDGLGTQMYQPPEVVTRGGTGPGCRYDAAAGDVWSLAVVLLVALHGSPPWSTASPYDPNYRAFLRRGELSSYAAGTADVAVRAARRCGPSAGRGLLKGLGKLLRRMLNPEPRERPTMAQVQAWFRSALSRRVPGARASSPSSSPCSNVSRTTPDSAPAPAPASSRSGGSDGHAHVVRRQDSTEGAAVSTFVVADGAGGGRGGSERPPAHSTWEFDVATACTAPLPDRRDSGGSRTTAGAHSHHRKACGGAGQPEAASKTAVPAADRSAGGGGSMQPAFEFNVATACTAHLPDTHDSCQPRPTLGSRCRGGARGATGRPASASTSVAAAGCGASAGGPTVGRTRCGTSLVDTGCTYVTDGRVSRVN